MTYWLQTFAYRIDPGLMPILVAGVLTFFVAIATVCWQSIRSALMNPVKSLRDE